MTENGVFLSFLLEKSGFAIVTEANAGHCFHVNNRFPYYSGSIDEDLSIYNHTSTVNNAWKYFLLAISSSKVPCSSILPFFITRILSYLFMSFSSSECVTTILVRPVRSRISEETLYAVWESSAAVISSARRTDESLRRLLAIEILCFSPPDKPLPFSPQR